MEWIELKRALVYGHPSMTKDMLQPQLVKTAVREIARLVSVGWIDEPNEAMVQRIQMACHAGHCDDVWDELQSTQHPLLRISKQSHKMAKPRKQKHP